MRRYKPLRRKPKKKVAFKELTGPTDGMAKIPMWAEGRVMDQAPSHVNPSGSSATPRQARPRYTGTQILGIATMHKSNAVPVTSKQQAEDTAKMRRN